MKKSNFDLLLKRYLTGQVSENERIKIEAWLDVMKTDEGTNLVLQKEDEEKLFDKISSNLDNVEEIIAFRPQQADSQPLQARPLLGRPWVKLAATVLLLVVASYAIWYITNSRPAIQQVIAKMDVEKFILNDGTIVWLRKGSELIYDPNTDDQIRHASLVGEALFEVAKDPGHPFIISCGNMIVKVYGTSFSLKTGNERIELQVLTGKVNLSSPGDRKGINVEPNEKAIYTSKGEIEKLKMNDLDLLKITTHTEYNMQFKNTAMDEVLDRIEKKFDADLVVEDNELNKCRITADFTDHSLETTLAMISELLEIEYYVNGSRVTISGKGCK